MINYVVKQAMLVYNYIKVNKLDIERKCSILF